MRLYRHPGRQLRPRQRLQQPESEADSARFRICGRVRATVESHGVRLLTCGLRTASEGTGFGH